MKEKKYLDDNEAIALVEILQSEDSPSAITALCENYSDFIRKIVSERILPGVEKRDLVQEGNLGVIEAALTFDKNRGVKFLTYAMSKARTRIINAVRNRHAVQLPREEVYSSSKFKPLQDNFSVEEEVFDCGDEDIDMSLAVLNEDEKIVIQLTFYEDLKITEIAEIMCMPWQTVHKIKINAIMKLKRNILNLPQEPEPYDERFEVHNDRWGEILFDIFDESFAQPQVLKIKYSITLEERKIIEAFHVRQNLRELGDMKTLRMEKANIVKKMGQTILELENRKTRVKLNLNKKLNEKLS